MAKKESIKGLTVKIGGDTTELGKALESVNKKSRNLSGELGQINKLLKLDPGNTELLAQKQKVLAEAISNTQERLGKLKEAEKDVQEQFKSGKIAESQYREIQREIIATEKKLESYEKAAKETAEAVEQLGNSADDTAEQLREQAKRAEDAEAAVEDLGSKAANAAKTGLSVLAGAATAVVGAMVAAAEQTREYRTAMGKLDTAFKATGKNSAEAYETYAELQGILGDTDQATEAANHLAELCGNAEELADWTEICTGVYAKFGDSLPVENLAEASNETVKTGKITGGLADALNWAGESEEEFQEALDKCNSEQERQQLITKTLTRLYKGAAAQYKKTNEEVIASNKATEKWNRSLAKVGKHVEPVITDFKELGAEILEGAEEPMKDLAGFITGKFIPALKSIGNWMKTNKKEITGTLTAVTVGLAGYKTAVIASELASKGMTTATLAQTAAQKLLNVAMKASPAGLLLTGIAALTAGVIAYATQTANAAAGVDVLTEEEKELMTAADEAAQAFKEQQEIFADQAGDILTEMEHVRTLADELQGLADASGRVKEADETRAQFIINELNEALGTEYSMVDGVIQKYDTLEESIYDVINAKTANSLLEAGNAAYVQAIQNENQAMQDLALSQKDYQAQLENTQEKRTEYTELVEELTQRLAECENTNDYRALQSLTLKKESLKSELAAEEKILSEKESNLMESAEAYEGYHNTIKNYEDAQVAALEGNAQKAIDLLTEKGNGYNAFADTVEEATANVLNTLYGEAIQAGMEAKRTKENFENGISGYTEGMVSEAERSYNNAMNEFANAYADAHSVGGDVSSGLRDGMESNRFSLLSKAKSLVSGIISAMREEADSHSPARKLIAFGEDLGEGAEIGMENKTQDLVKTAKNQTAAIIGAYGQQGKTQQTMRTVAEQQIARQAQTQKTMAGENGGVLQEILKAIKEGQVITIDSDKLVGATERKMDTALGRRRALTAMGVI